MEDNVVLITGGSGKLGTQIALSLLDKGHTVIVTKKTQSAFDFPQDFPEANKKLLHIIQTDFSADDAISGIKKFLDENGLKPTALVNAARSLDTLQTKSDGTVTRDNFMSEYLIDVVVPYELSMMLALSPGSRLKRIVNIGSQYGSVAANPHLYSDYERQSMIHYSVAKAGLNQLTRELAVRLAPKNIPVNCVAYGGVEGRVDEAFKERYAKLCPTGRMLGEDEIASPVLYLLLDASESLTGQILALDGGWSIW